MEPSEMIIDDFSDCFIRLWLEYFLYVDSFENVSDLDNFVSGELSAAIIKAINNMPVTKWLIRSLLGINKWTKLKRLLSIRAELYSTGTQVLEMH